MWFWVGSEGLTRRLGKGTDVGGLWQEDQQESVLPFSFFFFFGDKTFCTAEETQQLEMSLFLTVLDKLAYFLSLVAFCVSVSYSWLK